MYRLLIVKSVNNAPKTSRFYHYMYVCLLLSMRPSSIGGLQSKISKILFIFMIPNSAWIHILHFTESWYLHTYALRSKYLNILLLPLIIMILIMQYFIMMRPQIIICRKSWKVMLFEYTLLLSSIPLYHDSIIIIINIIIIYYIIYII